MTLEEFARLVELMRTAQKNYFDTRDHKILLTAKGLESRVDKAIGEMSEPGEQEHLFRQRLHPSDGIGH